MKKCDNCGERTKGCRQDSNPTCELRLPMIWQLIEPDKIDNFQKCLRSIGMKIEPIGRDDFRIIGT